MARLHGAARHDGDAGAGAFLGMQAEAEHLPRRLWLILGGLWIAWGFNWVAIKVAVSQVPPSTFRSLCLGLGSAVLFAVLRAGGQKLTVPKGQWPRLALLAFFN